MKRLVIKSPFSWSKLPVFVSGMILGAIVANPAFAYIGPGSGLTLIGSVLAVIAVIFLSIVGFIWYPVRRLLRNKKARKADTEQALTEKPGQ